mgnify:CR=1 FL=1
MRVARLLKGDRDEKIAGDSNAPIHADRLVGLVERAAVHHGDLLDALNAPLAHLTTIDQRLNDDAHNQAAPR